MLKLLGKKKKKPHLSQGSDGSNSVLDSYDLSDVESAKSSISHNPSKVSSPVRFSEGQVPNVSAVSDRSREFLSAEGLVPDISHSLTAHESSGISKSLQDLPLLDIAPVNKTNSYSSSNIQSLRIPDIPLNKSKVIDGFSEEEERHISHVDALSLSARDDKHGKKKGYGFNVSKALKNVTGKGSSSKSPKHEMSLTDKTVTGQEKESAAADALSSRSLSYIHNEEQHLENKVTALEIENKRLEDALAEANNYLEARTFTVQQLQVARDDDALQFRETLKKASLELDAAHEAYKELEQRFKVHKDSNEEKLLKDANDTILLLQTELDSGKKQREEDKANLEMLHTDAIQNQNQIAHLLQLNSNLQNEIEKAHHTEAGEEKLDETRYTILQNEIMELENKNMLLIEENERLERKLDEKTMELQNMTIPDQEESNSHNQLQLDIEKLKAQRDDTMARLSAAKIEVNELVEENDQLKQTKIDSAHKIAELEQQLNALRSGEDGKDDRQTGEISRLNAELSIKDTENKEFLNLIEDYRKETNQLEENYNNLYKERETLEAEIILLRKEIQSTDETQATESADIIDRLRLAETENNSYQLRIAELEKEIKDAKESIRHFLIEKENMELEKNSLEQQLEVYLTDKITDGTDSHIYYDILSAIESVHEKCAQLEAEKIKLSTTNEALMSQQMRADQIISELQLDNTELTKKIQLIENDIQQLKKINFDLSEANQQYVIKTQQYKEEIEKLKDTAAQLQIRISQLDSQAKLGDSVKRDSAVETIKLKSDLSLANAQLEDKNKELQLLKDSFKDLQKRITEKDASILSQSTELSHLNGVIEKLKREIQNKTDQFQLDLKTITQSDNQSSKELLLAQKELEKLRDTVKTMRKTIDGKSARLNSASDRENELRNTTSKKIKAVEEQKNSEIKTLNDTLDVQKTKNQELTKQISECQSQLKKTEKQITQLTLDLKQMEEKHSSTVFALQKAEIERDTIKQCNTTLTSQLESLSKAPSKANNELLEKDLQLNKTKQDFQKQLDSQGEELCALLEANSKLKHQVKSKEQHIEELQLKQLDNIARLQTKIAELEKRNDALQQRNELLKKSTTDVDQTATKPLEELNKQRLTDFQTEIDELKKQLVFLQHELNHTTKAYSLEQEKVKELKNDLDTFRTTVQSSHSENKVHNVKTKPELSTFQERNEKTIPSPKDNKNNVTWQTDKFHETNNVNLTGTVIMNALVVGSHLPQTILVHKNNTSSESNKINNTFSHVSIVCLLKTRLIHTLFEKLNPGEMTLPASLFGQELMTKSRLAACNRPMVSRVLMQMKKLWEFGEDLRYGLSEIDDSLKQKYQDTKYTSGDWLQTLECLRGSAEILEKRNLELETLCTSYAYAAKEAQTIADLDRVKHQTIASHLRQQINQLKTEVSPSHKLTTNHTTPHITEIPLNNSFSSNYYQSVYRPNDLSFSTSQNPQNTQTIRVPVLFPTNPTGLVQGCPENNYQQKINTQFEEQDRKIVKQTERPSHSLKNNFSSINKENSNTIISNSCHPSSTPTRTAGVSASWQNVPIHVIRQSTLPSYPFQCESELYPFHPLSVVYPPPLGHPSFPKSTFQTIHSPMYDHSYPFRSISHPVWGSNFSHPHHPSMSYIPSYH